MTNERKSSEKKRDLKKQTNDKQTSRSKFEIDVQESSEALQFLQVKFLNIYICSR